MPGDNSAIETAPRPKDTRINFRKSFGSSESMKKRQDAALKEANALDRPKTSLIKNVRNALLAFVAGGSIAGATDKAADTHIVDTTIDTTKTLIHTPIDAAQQATHEVTELPGNAVDAVKVVTIDSLTGNASTEIAHYNEEADKKLARELTLSEGETIREGVKVVQAANTFDKVEGSKIFVYAVPYAVAGQTEPIGTVMPGEEFVGRVLTVPDLIRADSREQLIDYDYGVLTYTDTDGKLITGKKVWVEGQHTVPISQSTPPEDQNKDHY